jgi:hypothetical protein
MPLRPLGADALPDSPKRAAAGPCAEVSKRNGERPRQAGQKNTRAHPAAFCAILCCPSSVVQEALLLLVATAFTCVCRVCAPVVCCDGCVVRVWAWCVLAHRHDHTSRERFGSASMVCHIHTYRHTCTYASTISAGPPNHSDHLIRTFGPCVHVY